MDLKQIKELMASMKKEGIKRLTIREKTGFEVSLESQDDIVAHPSPPSHYHAAYYPPHPPVKEELHLHAQSAPQIVQKAQEKEGKFINSPLVGTFYATPSPDDPPFVQMGDKVDENSVVCIIEAMKVMNEVKAGMSGTVAEILVDNGHPVEFGSKMFRIV